MNTSLGFFGGKYLQFMLPVAMGLCENKVPQNLMVRQYVPIRITHLGETFFFGGGRTNTHIPDLSCWHWRYDTSSIIDYIINSGYQDPDDNILVSVGIDPRLVIGTVGTIVSLYYPLLN